jgi:hypothetical protein
MRGQYRIVAATFVAGVLLYPVPARSEDVISGEQVVGTERVAESVGVHDLTVDGGVVSGMLTNRSGKTLRDVQLLIRHEWLWKNEFRPGGNSPSRAVYFLIRGDLPAGGETPFTYRADPPLPIRSDGRFNTSVQVVDFVEVGS